MPRERRSFKRITGVRDPSLIVIACEGAATEPVYFEGVESQCKAIGSRLKLKILPPRKGNLSAPKHVLEQMDSYKKEFGLNTGDELCLVIDRDPQSWTEQAISDIARDCDSKQYLLALSNPAFDLWLLLHHVDVDDHPAEERATLFQNRNSALKNKLREKITGYRSSSPDIDDFWPYTELAIARAQALDTVPGTRWPNTLGTRVYLILQKILDALHKAEHRA
ncbi:hypothetical protein GZ77_05065 [Endozoicomonas montiporae]|uniref:RloB-like protein n=2 Tax=Endozoicomonas montiporae TaxID=1027273 RepID=A0A081NBR2_9GAMM|nr:RloB family protein [Endozoicomonas montiporae]AMO56184.1 hypothetical protein EZMO1_2065 [Endozoicomonas montiporae CL-33]KEQ15885.1 hypothetical protein GZ77_05065 [Endozoicomonas montiporae]